MWYFIHNYVFISLKSAESWSCINVEFDKVFPCSQRFVRRCWVDRRDQKQSRTQTVLMRDPWRLQRPTTHTALHKMSCWRSLKPQSLKTCVDELEPFYCCCWFSDSYSSSGASSVTEGLRVSDFSILNHAGVFKHTDQVNRARPVFLFSLW